MTTLAKTQEDRLFGQPTDNKFVECPNCGSFGQDDIMLSMGSIELNPYNNRFFDADFECACLNCQTKFHISASGSLSSYRANGSFKVPCKDDDGEDTYRDANAEIYKRFI